MWCGLLHLDDHLLLAQDSHLSPYFPHQQSISVSSIIIFRFNSDHPGHHQSFLHLNRHHPLTQDSHLWPYFPHLQSVRTSSDLILVILAILRDGSVLITIFCSPIFKSVSSSAFFSEMVSDQRLSGKCTHAKCGVIDSISCERSENHICSCIAPQSRAWQFGANLGGEGQKLPPGAKLPSRERRRWPLWKWWLHFFAQLWCCRWGWSGGGGLSNFWKVPKHHSSLAKHLLSVGTCLQVDC